MKNLRWIALALAAVAVGYYLFHGLTYESAGPYEPAGMGWLGWQMALPIIAITLVPLVFSFTGKAF